MAIEVTEFLPALETFPWSDTDAPDPADRGIRPIANLRAVLEDGIVPVPGAGDFQMFRANVTLPPNFVYSLQDAYVNIGGAGLVAASNWETIASFTYQDATSGNNTFVCHFPLFSRGAVTLGVSGSSWTQPYCIDCPFPTFLQKAGSLFSVRLINRTVDDIAITVDILLNFLVFTVAQEFDAGVNTPLLTR